MIVVLATFDVAPEDSVAFVESKLAQVERTLAEDGCLEYAFSLDVHHDGRVRLTERWESMNALTAHVQALRAQPATGADIPVLSRTFMVLDGTEVDGL